MGYRGTFITEHVALDLPEWFISKYKENYHFNGNGLPISSKHQSKRFYDDIENDLQKCFCDAKMEYVTLFAAWLWEDGAITRMCFGPGERYEEQDFERPEINL